MPNSPIDINQQFAFKNGPARSGTLLAITFPQGTYNFYTNMAGSAEYLSSSERPVGQEELEVGLTRRQVMNNKLKANLARPRPQIDDVAQQTLQKVADQFKTYQPYGSSWEADLLEEYHQAPPTQSQQPSSHLKKTQPFPLYNPILNHDDDIRSMDFFCQGANILPAPSTVLERPRATPTPPLPRPSIDERGRSSHESYSSSSYKPNHSSEDEKRSKGSKLAQIFGLVESDKERERRLQEEAGLERQRVDANKKFADLRQRGKERDREREYWMRKEAERQTAETETEDPGLEEEFFYPTIVVDLGATPSSSNSRSGGHRSKSKSSHSKSHTHSHSHSKSHSHSHSHSSKSHSHSKSHSYAKSHHSKSHSHYHSHSRDKEDDHDHGSSSHRHTKSHSRSKKDDDDHKHSPSSLGTLNR